VNRGDGNLFRCEEKMESTGTGSCKGKTGFLRLFRGLTDSEARGGEREIDFGKKYPSAGCSGDTKNKACRKIQRGGP